MQLILYEHFFPLSDYCYFVLVWTEHECTCCGLEKAGLDSVYYVMYVYLLVLYLTTLNVAQTVLTYSMEQSPSWETDRFSVSQEIPHILRNPKVHYRNHKCPLTVPILIQLDQVHALTSHSRRSFLILSSHLRLGLPSCLFPSGFPTTVLYTPLPQTYYIHRPTHSSRFDHPHTIWWAVQIIKLLVMSFSSLPCYLLRLRPK